MDELDNGKELLDYMKNKTGQKTVPMVFINGELLGGCDATKAAIGSGEFDRRLGAGKGATQVSVDVDNIDFTSNVEDKVQSAIKQNR